MSLTGQRATAEGAVMVGLQQAAADSFRRSALRRALRLQPAQRLCLKLCAAGMAPRTLVCSLQSCWKAAPQATQHWCLNLRCQRLLTAYRPWGLIV